MGKVWLLIACAGIAWAQDGSAVYQAHCAGCHDKGQGRVPPVSALRSKTAPAIQDTLKNGVMKAQAAGLTEGEIAAVAAYLGTATSVLGKGASNICQAGSAPASGSSVSGGWSSWGVNAANTRFQTAAGAGLKASQVAGLRLKWAFSLGSDAEPRSQPAVINGTIYVGANKLYALDAQTGCTRWVFEGDAPVRSGLVTGEIPGGKNAVFFGDYKAHIYAIDTGTGKLLWKAHVDENFAAMVTSTPVVYQGVVYAGISSFEEVMAASPKYRCCSFRGSVVALNAATGERIWKTFTIDESREIAGTTFRGPSGAGVWSSPTIDIRLKRLYVSTGDNYSEPATGTSDAVLALDMATGKILWTSQATAGDIYNTGCDPGVHGACPEAHGHDFDFGQPPILLELDKGKRALLIGQKSGVVYAFDPDANGKPMWNRRIGEGGTLGGIQWGSAAQDGRVYVALSDLRLHGVPDRTRRWATG